MKKSYLTFVTSYLLLTAFMGSAEAKKFEAGHSDDTNILQLATERSARMTNAAAGGLNGEMQWLLTSYYGIAAESLVIDPGTPRTDSNEVALAGENEEDSSLDDEMWVVPNKFASRGYAGPLFNEAFPGASKATTGEEASASAAASAGGKIPAEKSESRAPLSYSMVDPPIVIDLNPRATPKPTRTEKNTDSGGASGPAATPEVVSSKPGTGSSPASLKKDQPKGGPPDKPRKNEEKKPVAQPELVIDPITIPATTIAAIAGEQKTVKLKKTQKTNDRSERETPNEEIATSPAPVPEPATMLLLTAGIASLAIGGVRRNKPAGPGNGTNSSI